MTVDRIGWDIGGAHLKAAGLYQGKIVAVTQRPCPLWRGLEHLHAAVESILAEFAPDSGCRHVVTMTGELVDLFDHRAHGVFELIRAMRAHCAVEDLSIFAGMAGFIPADQVGSEQVDAIASANWLATGLYVARHLQAGMLIDIGSTTADLLVVRDGEIKMRGHTDYDRLRHDELVYTGVVRTSLMAVAERVPFEGEWLPVMAEHFATMADVYRLTGELPEHADQSETADGGPKTIEASARRLARMVGRDRQSAQPAAWSWLARYFRECQLNRLSAACQRHWSRGLLKEDAPLVGAGVGRFLVQELARRFGASYLDFNDLLPRTGTTTAFDIADCAPAVALACLAESQP
jgi:probable H4MPT-linked C1 transfer pathway protein